MPAPDLGGYRPVVVAQRPQAATAEGSERILVYAPTGRDGTLITETLRQAGFDPLRCGGVGEVCEHIRRGEAAVAFVAEEALVRDTTPSFEAALLNQPAWSDIPIILMTSGGKTTQYSERLARRLEGVGNLTLLERPLRILTLVSAVQSALRGRRKQYQVRRLLQEKEEAVRQRDRFLAMLGHELRNPLAAIRTAAEVLSQCGPDDRDLLHEHCEIVKRQASNQSRLVEDLLDVARATAGKITLNRKRLDLREVVRLAMDGVKLALGTQRHDIVVKTPAEPATVEGDPVRLEQVVVNLVTNAVKYTPPGGRIEVHLAHEDDNAVLRVMDGGEGIPPHMLARIFEPFVQVEQNLDRSRGGLGLGLPLVKALLELHHGGVEAFSAGAGRGSEFVVRIPLAPTKPPPQQSLPAADDRGSISRRVLVVEDRADTRAAMRSLIRLWGHQVVVAEDGPSGVQRAQEFRPEVALVDIGLPGFDGYQVAQLIRETLGREICLVALTGYGQPEDRQRAKAAGFNLHLVKPIEPDQLAELLLDPVARRDDP